MDPPDFTPFTAEEKRILKERVKKDSEGDEIIDEVMEKVIPEEIQKNDPQVQSNPEDPLLNGFRNIIESKESHDKKPSSNVSESIPFLKKIGNSLKDYFSLVIQILKSDSLRWILILLIALLLGFLLGSQLVPDPPPIVV